MMKKLKDQFGIVLGYYTIIAILFWTIKLIGLKGFETITTVIIFFIVNSFYIFGKDVIKGKELTLKTINAIVLLSVIVVKFTFYISPYICKVLSQNLTNTYALPILFSIYKSCLLIFSIAVSSALVIIVSILLGSLSAYILEEKFKLIETPVVED